MKQQEVIKADLIGWAEKMVEKHRWLSIRMEYSEALSVFLVAYYAEDDAEMTDVFFRDAELFEDELIDVYGDDAPLFSLEDDCFRVSPAAQIFQAERGYIHKNVNTKSLGQRWTLVDRSSMGAECVDNLRGIVNAA